MCNNDSWRRLRIKLQERIFSKEKIIKLAGFYGFEIYFGTPKSGKLVKNYPEIIFLSNRIHSTSTSPSKNEICKNVKGGLTLLFRVMGLISHFEMIIFRMCFSVVDSKMDLYLTRKCLRATKEMLVTVYICKICEVLSLFLFCSICSGYTTASYNSEPPEANPATHAPPPIKYI